MAPPGFARPVQSSSLTPAVEAVVAESCPGSRIAPWDDDPNRHPYWGPARDTRVGFALDDQVRHAGASGGLLSALVIHALDIRMIDRVLHVEADPDQPTGNRMRWSRTREDVLAGAGSRYAPSSPLEHIDAALSEGGRFAFIGKPCDVSALRQLAKHDRRVDAHVPLMLSFYCGGLPSRSGADRVIRAMGLEPLDLVSFRYRGNGWPGLTVAQTGAGDIGEMRYADSWGRHLSKEVQFRCKICPDAVGAVADIACADAWYGDEGGYPSFDEQDGRSLLQVRTAVGEALVQSALAANALRTESLPVGEIELMQPSQANRKRLIVARTAACRILMRPVPAMENLDVERASKLAPSREKIRNFLGSISRIMRRRN
nr:Coenzyme F420 hydrogenase/dehydrogenase, beta subunit C-terminal domain [Sphingobium yanoikuyae]